MTISREADHAVRQRERDDDAKRSKALLVEADTALAEAREAEVAARHWSRVYRDRERGG